MKVVVHPDYVLNGRLTSSKTANEYVQRGVTLTARAKGGYGKLQYRFTEAYGASTFLRQDYSENNKYSFTTVGPGRHIFYVDIKDSQNQVVRLSYTMNVVVHPDNILKAKLVSNKSNYEYVSRGVTLTITSNGGYGETKYRFTEVFNGNTKIVQDFSEDNTYSFRTTKPGVHTFYVDAMDKEGQFVKLTFVQNVVVEPAFKLTGSLSSNASGEIKENQKIVLTAQAKNGYGGPYKYKFTESYNGKTKTLQAYSEKNTCEFNIKGSGSHIYTVTIMDSEGQTVSCSKTISFGKNGWFYENGYKFYYKDGIKQLDLDGILPKQSSYYIEVNRTTCTVTVYAKDGNNGYIIPVKRFACSVGLSSTPTPTGTYYTQNKYRWHTLIGPSYGQYCTRIVGGVLFHSVAGYNMTSYNLKASDYNKLGSPASHGCVRLCVRDAKWIYDNCSLGTRVRIFDSSNPGPLGKPDTIKIPSWQNWDPTDPNV